MAFWRLLHIELWLRAFIDPPLEECVSTALNKEQDLLQK
jgi:hypothetical protein